MALFKIKNLSFTYPDAKDYALDNINLHINEGEFVVIAGESGCGKTTLLRLLKQELSPHGSKSGQVLFRNVLQSDLDPFTSASKIGYVLQNPDSQIVTDKVWHELAFGLESLGYSQNVIRRRVAEMASYFGIEKWFRRDTNTLSGGQKQLLNLASIMALQPDVLILDEPTAQLDPIAASDFLNTLVKINEELGLTIILVEHRLEDIFPCADRVIIMEKAKVLLDDTAQNVASQLTTLSNNHMFYSLPSSIRLYASLNQGGRAPLTLKEAREYLVTKNTNEIRTLFTPIEEKNNPIINIKNAWFRYERNLDDVLRGIDLTINAGEIFCLLGGNGTGKSTLLKNIANIETIYRGKIKVNNQNIKRYRNNELYKHNLTLLPQNPEDLFLKDTVYEDLLEICKVMDYDKQKTQEIINEVLSLLDIAHLQEQNPYDLSGGEKQKAALAKILILDPQILLLDEPTKGIDAYSKTILESILFKLKEQGKTIFIVSHDLEFCASVADRCGLLFDGQIAAIGSPQEFFSENSFYTTSANRISRGFYDHCVTIADIIELAKENEKYTKKSLS